MRELALFTGAGGGILGTRLLGWRVVCGVEIDPYCREILLRRQEEGHLEPFPIWDDARTFKGKPWRKKVDVITAGFPCQPFSVAGKRLGVDDKRNLWPEAYRIIQEVRPRHVLLENVPGIRKYLPVVIRDLRRAGYAPKRPLTIAAAALGTGHIRRRVWIYVQHKTYRRRPRRSRRSDSGAQGKSKQAFSADNLCNRVRKQPGRGGRSGRSEETVLARVPWWKSEPRLARLVRRPAYRVERIKATGNIQVPAVVKAAWGLLKKC